MSPTVTAARGRITPRPRLCRQVFGGWLYVLFLVALTFYQTHVCILWVHGVLVAEPPGYFTQGLSVALRVAHPGGSCYPAFGYARWPSGIRRGPALLFRSSLATPRTPRRCVVRLAYRLSLAAKMSANQFPCKVAWLSPPQANTIGSLASFATWGASSACVPPQHHWGVLAGESPRAARHKRVRLFSAKTDAILEQLKGLTLFEAAELVRQMEDTFGVSAATVAPVASTTDAAAAAEEPKEPEKTVFTVHLVGVDTAKRVAVIKLVRTMRKDLGLKEAKDFVDSLPKAVVENVPKEEAEAVVKKIEAAGGKAKVE
eukprot:GHVT01098219.1.p1 GENE.GHVT01098219.1~~GHVT01098219.1.p1  ORF type:complete len:315 (+),score=37.39 GHVT01098219.1:301-1245(+)